jgi:hypothetical protein
VLDELEASIFAEEGLGKPPGGAPVLQDSAGMDLPPPARKTIDLEGKLIKDGVRKAIRDRQNALHELVYAINHYRKLSESKPLTLQGPDYDDAALELNRDIDRAEGLLLQ